MAEKLWKRIMEVALNKGFFYPSEEPYGGVSGFYDYGPVGVLLKNKVENAWRHFFIRRSGAMELSTCLVMPEIALKASGHVDSFTDPIVACKVCGAKTRADHLAEDKLEGFKWDGDFQALKRLFEEKKDVLRCPKCGGELGEVTVFNLMFKTSIGAERQVAYLRPETAQGIFVSFLRAWRLHGSKLPFAVAQIGKVFRNEISPRNVLVRLREFSQMELEYFFNPSNKDCVDYDSVKDVKIRFYSREAQEKGEQGVDELPVSALVEQGIVDKLFAYFLAQEWLFYTEIGMDMTRCRFRELMKNELPHYSAGNIDMEVETSYGIIETIGNANRTDYDLSQHQKFSGKKFEVLDAATGERLVPHVFEISFGVDRLIFSLLEHTYVERDDGSVCFKLPLLVAPYQYAVCPIVKKDELLRRSKEVVSALRESGKDVLYLENGSMKKRLAKADGVGVPTLIILDERTLDDGTITVRDRDKQWQERVDLKEWLSSSTTSSL